MGNFFKPDKIFCLILWLLLSEFSSPGHNLWYLTFFQFIPFFFILKKYPKQWIKNSIIFGLFYYIFYYRWLVYPVKYIEAPIIIGIINVILMGIYQTIYFLIFSVSVRFTKNIFIPSVIWGLLEFIRANILTGFPWGEISYNLYCFPSLIQIASLINSEGISIFIIFVNLFIFNFYFMDKKYKLLGSIVIIFYVLVNLFMYFSLNFSKLNLKIAMIQGNIPEEIKLNDKNAELIIKKYKKLTKKAHATLTIWPEAIYIIPFENDNSTLKKDLLNFINDNKINLIFGSPTITFDLYHQKYKYYNSMFFITSNLNIFRYDKIKLVPFGEFTPYKKIFFFVNKIVPGEDYSPGDNIELFQLGKYKIIPLICYEGIFHYLIKEGVKKGGNLIVNISNEAWFGNSYALWQHIAANVLRTIEFRKFFLKCANSGISTIIDPKGRIIKLIPPLQEGIIRYPF